MLQHSKMISEETWAGAGRNFACNSYVVVRLVTTPRIPVHLLASSRQVFYSSHASYWANAEHIDVWYMSGCMRQSDFIVPTNWLYPQTVWPSDLPQMMVKLACLLSHFDIMNRGHHQLASDMIVVSCLQYLKPSFYVMEMLWCVNRALSGMQQTKGITAVIAFSLQPCQKCKS